MTYSEMTCLTDMFLILLTSNKQYQALAAVLLFMRFVDSKKYGLSPDVLFLPYSSHPLMAQFRVKVFKSASFC